MCDVRSSNVQIEGLESALNASVVYSFMTSSMVVKGVSKNRRRDRYFESLAWEERNEQWLAIEQDSRD